MQFYKSTLLHEIKNVPQKCPQFKYAQRLLFEVLSTWDEVTPHFSGAFGIPGIDRRELLAFPCQYIEYCSNLPFCRRAGRIWVQPVCCPNTSVLAGSCDQMLFQIQLESPSLRKRKKRIRRDKKKIKGGQVVFDASPSSSVCFLQVLLSTLKSNYLNLCVIFSFRCDLQCICYFSYCLVEIQF